MFSINRDELIKKKGNLLIDKNILNFDLKEKEKILEIVVEILLSQSKRDSNV